MLPHFSAPERPEDLHNEASVHLFLDRARSASPDFALTPRNAPAIAALCRRLECVPLALELAAARAGSLSPARILALLVMRLDDGEPTAAFKRFDFLQSRERTSPARHRTLRAALDWSYDLLEPPLQHFLAGLAVFRGGCTVEAACEVCDEKNALSFLEHLRECSLLLPGHLSEGEPRFTMLEIIREYAFEQLEARSGTAEMRSRHARYFLKLAEAEAPNFLASDAKERLLCLERVKEEHDNLRAAMAWSLEHDAQMALRLVLACDALSGDSLRKAELPIERALQNTDGASDALVGAVLDIAVAHAGHRGDFVRQTELALWRRELARKCGEPSSIAWASFSLGSAERRTGRFSEAREHLSHSVEIFRQLQDWQCVGWALNELGNTTLDANDVAATCTTFEECAEAFARSGDRDGVASARAQLADALYYAGDSQRARQLFEEVAAIEHELGDHRDHFWRRHQLGKIEGSLGNYDTAHALLKGGLRSFVSGGNKVGMLCSLMAFGCLAADEGRYEQAVCLLSAQAAQRAALQWPPLLQGQGVCDRALDLARAALNASEYSKACTRGESLTLPEAIELSMRT
jgi:tetratricopeptide (TPR) repeat protein